MLLKTFSLAVIATALLGLVGAGSASATDFTWNGSQTSSTWSTGLNWDGGVAPTNPAGNVTFPALTGCSAPSACYTTVDDIAGLSATSIRLDDEAPYVLAGNQILTLTGATGIQASASAAVSSKPTLTLPLAIGTASQTWAIDGNSNLGGGLTLTGQIQPTANALAVQLSRSATLLVTPKDDELGALTLSGTNLGDTGSNAAGNGTITLSGSSGNPVRLNATSGNPLNVTDVQLVAYDGTQLGALRSTGADMQVGLAAPSPGTVSVPNGGATLDANTVLGMTIGQAGTTPGTDYSQLSASGNVNLGGATLNLGLGPTCPNLNPGDVDTLITTSGGTVTSTFAGISDGGTITTPVSQTCAQQATLRINYNATTVTATVVSEGAATPVNQTAPSISGNTTQGQVLSETNGTWTNNPSSYSYQWEDCDSSGGGCAPISGATNKFYTLAAGDVGHTIRVQEIATNGGGSGVPAMSARTGVVQGPSSPPAKPASSVQPSVTGVAAVGQKLSATTGAWSGTPTINYSYQWFRCDLHGCNPIGGADRSSYMLVSADLASDIYVAVTAKNGVGSQAQASATVGPVYPSISTITADLENAFKGFGKDLHLGPVLKNGDFTLSLPVPSGGLLAASWYLASTVPGGHLAAVRKGAPLGSVRERFAVGGRARVRLPLTKSGMRRLRHGKRPKILFVITFTPTAGTPVTVSKSRPATR